MQHNSISINISRNIRHTKYITGHITDIFSLTLLQHLSFSVYWCICRNNVSHKKKRQSVQVMFLCRIRNISFWNCLYSIWNLIWREQHTVWKKQNTLLTRRKREEGLYNERILQSDKHCLWKETNTMRRKTSDCALNKPEVSKDLWAFSNYWITKRVTFDSYSRNSLKTFIISFYPYTEFVGFKAQVLN